MFEKTKINEKGRGRPVFLKIVADPYSLFVGTTLSWRMNFQQRRPYLYSATQGIKESEMADRVLQLRRPFQ